MKSEKTIVQNKDIAPDDKSNKAEGANLNVKIIQDEAGDKDKEFIKNDIDEMK